MKTLLSGAIILASLGLVMGRANAAVPVIRQCPTATWTVGYNLWELIPLAKSQYKPAIVIASSGDIRMGMGYDSPVLFTVNAGTPVTVVGEAWDTGCNQWMRIQMGSRLYWIHGNQIDLL